MKLEDLADAYLLHYKTRKDKHFWAWEKVDELIRSDPEEGWEVILILIEKAPTDWELGDISAGPLEDLLVRHGSDFIDRVEEQSRRNNKFQKTLAGVWGWNSMDKDIWKRVIKFRGPA